MYCTHITNEKEEIYETDENLQDIFERKMKKLITWVKTSKITRGNWKGADELISRLSKFKYGILEFSNEFLDITLLYNEKIFYIEKANVNYQSIRYYYTKEVE